MWLEHGMDEHTLHGLQIFTRAMYTTWCTARLVMSSLKILENPRHGGGRNICEQRGKEVNRRKGKEAKKTGEWTALNS